MDAKIEAENLRREIVENIFRKLDQLEWMSVDSTMDRQNKNYTSVPWNCGTGFFTVHVVMENQCSCLVNEYPSGSNIYAISQNEGALRIWKALNELFAKGGDEMLRRSQELIKAEEARREAARWNDYLEKLRRFIAITK